MIFCLRSHHLRCDLLLPILVLTVVKVSLVQHSAGYPVGREELSLGAVARAARQELSTCPHLALAAPSPTTPIPSAGGSFLYTNATMHFLLRLNYGIFPGNVPPQQPD